MKRDSPRISSKLLKHRLLTTDPELIKYLPAMSSYSKVNLRSMLQRYGMVYIKPDTGSMGNGIIRVEVRKGTYNLHSGDRNITYSSFERLVFGLKRHVKHRQHLIQQGIHVLKYEKRPYDFRVMIQRSPSGKWVPTGTAGRVAPPGLAVTNGSQGGTIYAADELLRHTAGIRKTSHLLKQMNRIAKQTSSVFASKYPLMNELGLDVAIDKQFKLWILEVNTRPDPCPFTKLSDHTLITRIIAYGKGYGRSYCLRCGKARSAKVHK
ncbi:hypothetical protein J2Z69_002542 [Paenibacillus shirakamiensis]|uniref:YheC/YheD family protein n=1 Tax=Paenibacillus shirakamiensis TaxID=1265935 RepID=A0ABS4JIG8_9BACL|nr:YheC/YheD family protein [Paenibacillus shirakamiensis]MBP2001497.1 hypothetical protein [Paenibacillus shirakamiensis]